MGQRCWQQPLFPVSPDEVAATGCLACIGAQVLQHLQDEVATQGMQTAGLRGSRNFLLAAPPSDAAPLPRLAVSADRLDPVLLYSNGSETQSVSLASPHPSGIRIP